MKLINAILCLFSHDWRSVLNYERKCNRCHKMQVKDFTGTWVNYTPVIKRMTVFNDEIEEA